jgi:hypothetical protein
VQSKGATSGVVRDKAGAASRKISQIKGIAIMLRPLIFGLAVLLFAASVTAPALAEYRCDPGQGAKCHCLGGDNCKELEKSGMCGNNSLICTSNQIGTGYGCDCTAKLKGVDTKSLNQKRPVSKSQ